MADLPHLPSRLPRLEDLGAGIVQLLRVPRPAPLARIRAARGARRPVAVQRRQPAVELGLEARAAREVVGLLPERIVYRELARRQELFEYQSMLQGGIPAGGGYYVQFIIQSVTPPVALDVIVYLNRDEAVYPGRDEAKAAVVEAAGYRYQHLWEQDIVRQDARWLEEQVTEIVGSPVGATAFGQRAAAAFEFREPLAAVGPGVLIGPDQELSLDAVLSLDALLGLG